MSEQDISSRIKAELEALEAEEVNINFKYKNTYHSGMGTFDLLQDIERIRKRRAALKYVLRILEVFK